MSFIWISGLLAYIAVSGLKDSLLYVRFMVHAEHLQDNASAQSFIWLVVSFAAFLLGTAISPRPRFDASPAQWSDARAARGLVIAFSAILVVAFLWVGTTVLRVGLGNLINLANSQNAYAREIVLNGAFPGGRLISNGFIGIAVFSAAFLAMPRAAGLSYITRAVVLSIMLVSYGYLGLIPILTSGRINFFAAIIASYIAICIVRRRLYGAIYIPAAIFLMSIVWTAKQYLSLHQVMQISIIDQSIQGFAFYLYNDMSNALNIIGHLDGHYQFGYNSLRFVFFFSFTNTQILKLLVLARPYAAPYIGGGEFPLLTAPYVDFGILGLLLVIIFGATSQWAYRKARIQSEFAPLYGLVFAGLALSIHSSYLSLQDSVFSMILIYILIKSSRVDVRGMSAKALTARSSVR